MYEAFFGLRERPFELTANPRFLVATRSHAEALANLEYGIASRKGITLLIGEAGTGKTTMVRTAIERQPARVHCVYLNNPALTRDEFVEMLAARFELSDEARSSKAACLNELEALLRRRRNDDAQDTTVLVVDEAQSLPFELLEEIRLLANIETNEDKLLTVILAGQPELAARMNDQSLRQLKQRIALRCTLEPLGLQETATYLSGRIQAAGGAGPRVLTQDAVVAIHEHSRGIPRAINVLMDNALVSAFAMQQRPVTRQVVLDVSRDFDLGLEHGPLPGQPTSPVVASSSKPLAAGAAPPSAQPAAAPTPPVAGRLLRLEPAAPAEVAMASMTTAEPETPLETTAAKRRRFFLF